MGEYNCPVCRKKLPLTKENPHYTCCGINYIMPENGVVEVKDGKHDIKEIVNKDENIPQETKDALNRLM